MRGRRTRRLSSNKIGWNDELFGREDAPPGRERKDGRHEQGTCQNRSPRCSFCKHIANAKDAQGRPDENCQKQRTQRRIKNCRDHYFASLEFFPFFLPSSCNSASAMRAARRCSSARSRTFESTMPTSSASTEPSQNESTMRFTAR